VIPARKPLSLPLPLAPQPLVERRRLPAKGKKAALMPRLVRRVALVLVVCGLLFGFSVHRQAQIAGRERDIARLTAQIAAMEAHNAKLQVEALALASLPRIERVARQELGLINPQGKQLLWVGVNGGN